MTQADENITGVTGAHTTDGLPHGATSLTPFIAIRGAAEAIEFYQNVFGARLIDKTEFGGVIVHADIDFGTGHLQLGEPNEEYGLIPAPAGAGSGASGPHGAGAGSGASGPHGAGAGSGPDADCYSLGLYRPNVDEVVAKAVEAGATVREAPATFVSGDRFASIRDPFGVRWSVMTRVEDLSEEESARRVADWAATQQ